MAANVRALCRCGIRIPSARNRCPAFDKNKCLEPMFGDVGQARTNAAMLLLMIDTTSSRTCTKPTVSGCFLYDNPTTFKVSQCCTIYKSCQVCFAVCFVISQLNKTYCRVCSSFSKQPKSKSFLSIGFG